jgi:hypothetical protein
MVTQACLKKKQEIKGDESLWLPGNSKKQGPLSPTCFFFLLRRWRKGERVSAYNKYCTKMLGKCESYKLMTWD